MEIWIPKSLLCDHVRKPRQTPFLFVCQETLAIASSIYFWLLIKLFGGFLFPGTGGKMLYFFCDVLRSIYGKYS